MTIKSKILLASSLAATAIITNGALNGNTAFAEEKGAETTVNQSTDQNIISKGKCGDNAYWELGKDGILMISGHGHINDKTCYLMPWYKQKNINKVIIGNGIDRIGSRAFEDCNFEQIEIPNTVKSIGSEAFKNCRNLKSVEIPNSVPYIEQGTFLGCSALANVQIPNSVTLIGEYAFWGCKALKNVNIPQTVTCIGKYAFEDFSKIKTIAVKQNKINPNNTEAVESDILAQGKCGDYATWVLKKDFSLTISGYGAMYDYDYNGSPWFKYRHDIKTISVNEDINKIGQYAFFECEKIKKLEFKGKLENVGNYAFYGCKKLTELVFYNDVDNVGAIFFQDRPWPTFHEVASMELKKVKFYGKVGTIEGTFRFCINLKEVIFYDEVKCIKDAAFWTGWVNDSQLEDIVFHKKVGYISDDWALYCAKRVTFYDDVEQIKSTNTGEFIHAVPINPRLKYLTFYRNVGILGKYAFYKVKSLERVEFHGKIETIEDKAFSGCENLTIIGLNE